MLWISLIILLLIGRVCCMWIRNLKKIYKNKLNCVMAEWVCDRFIREKRSQLTFCHDTWTDTCESLASNRPMRSGIRFCALQSKPYTMPSPIRATYQRALHLLVSKCHRDSFYIWCIVLSAAKKCEKWEMCKMHSTKANRTKAISSPCPMLDFLCILGSWWNFWCHFGSLCDRNKPNCEVRRLCYSWFHAEIRVRNQNCPLYPVLSNTVWTKWFSANRNGFWDRLWQHLRRKIANVT